MEVMYFEHGTICCDVEHQGVAVLSKYRGLIAWYRRRGEDEEDRALCLSMTQMLDGDILTPPYLYLTALDARTGQLKMVGIGYVPHLFKSFIHSPEAVLDDDEIMECGSKVSSSSAHLASCVCEPHRNATQGSPLVPRLWCIDTSSGKRCVPITREERRERREERGKRGKVSINQSCHIKRRRRRRGSRR